MLPSTSPRPTAALFQRDQLGLGWNWDVTELGSRAMELRSREIGSVVVVLAIAAATAFGVIALQEFTYANDHPFAYGPAKVIAWGGVAGAVLAIAVGLLGLAARRVKND